MAPPSAYSFFLWFFVTLPPPLPLLLSSWSSLLPFFIIAFIVVIGVRRSIHSRFTSDVETVVCACACWCECISMEQIQSKLQINRTESNWTQNIHYDQIYIKDALTFLSSHFLCCYFVVFAYHGTSILMFTRL